MLCYAFYVKTQHFSFTYHTYLLFRILYGKKELITVAVVVAVALVCQEDRLRQGVESQHLCRQLVVIARRVPWGATDIRYQADALNVLAIGQDHTGLVTVVEAMRSQQLPRSDQECAGVAVVEVQVDAGLHLRRKIMNWI